MSDDRDRVIMASVKLGNWLSAALDDPAVCEAMKDDIHEWFSAGEPHSVQSAALQERAAVLGEILAVCRRPGRICSCAERITAALARQPPVSSSGVIYPPDTEKLRAVERIARDCGQYFIADEIAAALAQSTRMSDRATEHDLTVVNESIAIGIEIGTKREREECARIAEQSQSGRIGEESADSRSRVIAAAILSLDQNENNLPSSRDLIDLGFAKGQAQERAAVVAWLRSVAEMERQVATQETTVTSIEHRLSLAAAYDCAADAIERCNHIRSDND